MHSARSRFLSSVSKSIQSVLYSSTARHEEIAAAAVVLPVPPFPDAMTIIFPTVILLALKTDLYKLNNP
jgi:hypothetical protein